MQLKLRYVWCVVENAGTGRPGGRTARTRRAVLDSVRELLRDPGADLSIPAIAAGSGVHATTIYRRWRTIETLVLEVAVEDVTAQSPLSATGDLKADLTTYVHQLLTAIQKVGYSRFFDILLAAARQASDADEVSIIVAPRLDQFQTMLDAAAVTRVDAMRLVEIIIAPAYFWAQLGAPLDPEKDTHRLVETALLSAKGTRKK